MNQYYVFFLALLHVAGVTAALAAETYPICTGGLAKVGTITDDRSKPSKNIAVWNRSMCANPFYDDDSIICTECWYSYSKQFSRWERSSELPDSFRRPLSVTIRQFPLPPAKEIKSLVVYSQQVAGAQVTESVLFWCTDSPTLLDPFRDYCRVQNLSIDLYRAARMHNQTCVTIKTKPNKITGANHGQAATVCLNMFICPRLPVVAQFRRCWWRDNGPTCKTTVGASLEFHGDG